MHEPDLLPHFQTALVGQGVERLTLVDPRRVRRTELATRGPLQTSTFLKRRALTEWHETCSYSGAANASSIARSTLWIGRQWARQEFHYLIQQETL